MTQGPNVRLKYKVEELEGTVQSRKVKFTNKGIEEYYLEEPAGFMVHVPKRHSFRVKDEAGLEALGLKKDSVFFDDDNEVSEVLVNAIAEKVAASMVAKSPAPQPKRGN